MVKIGVAIYLFGVYLELRRFYGERNFYKRIGDIAYTIHGIVQVIFWPIRWFKNFINYYLNDSTDYMK